MTNIKSLVIHGITLKHSTSASLQNKIKDQINILNKWYTGTCNKVYIKDNCF